MARLGGKRALRAVGLAIAGCGRGLPRLVSGVPIAAAIALGAIVVPPDPQAVTALARLLGLPRRLVVVMGQEGCSTT
ncbi:hypothetical protein [Nocardia bhagyanarayanae]|uniref:Uncharacterized protein n=1 Tax=Nocardia bhagyanarayanae TaxID=1215925 RepID=A0A543EUX2_9NOCA|nr:hypothetical protein [Nocardia bhagyanarayanae]TQM25370.1 hypothetical protein FB390_5518 [Nocardia bhagyanarayanae]